MAAQPQQRGRPFGNKELRVLRSKTWYLNVKSREGLSDCQLDVMFGTGPNQLPRGTADRIKVFEAIRVNGSIPASGTSNKRGFDLVAYIDGHPDYAGTAAILNSPFWRLMEDCPMNLRQIREMIVECTDLLGLVIKEGNYVDEWEDVVQNYIDHHPKLPIDEYIDIQSMDDEPYDNAMFSAFADLRPSLDFLALLGALSFEAIEAGNRKLAFYHLDIFRITLRHYCDQEWLNHNGKKVRGDKEKGGYDDTGKKLRIYAVKRIISTLYADPLKGLPSYTSMLSVIPEYKPNSAVSAFLNSHQRALWSKGRPRSLSLKMKKSYD